MEAGSCHAFDIVAIGFEYSLEVVSLAAGVSPEPGDDHHFSIDFSIARDSPIPVPDFPSVLENALPDVQVDRAKRAGEIGIWSEG
jgi:hypothetical protein